MSENRSPDYVPMKEAYILVIGDGEHSTETIDLCEERIRQAGALGELSAFIVGPSGIQHKLSPEYFFGEVFYGAPVTSAGKAIVFDITTNKEEIVNGRVFINQADIQKIAHRINRDLTEKSSPIPQEIDMSKPEAKKFHSILKNVAYVMTLPDMQESRETDWFEKAKKDFNISLSESTIKNIWNGSYSVSTNLGFTKDYIKKNYHKC